MHLFNRKANLAFALDPSHLLIALSYGNFVRQKVLKLPYAKVNLKTFATKKSPREIVFDKAISRYDDPWSRDSLTFLLVPMLCTTQIDFMRSIVTTLF